MDNDTDNYDNPDLADTKAKNAAVSPDKKTVRSDRDFECLEERDASDSHTCTSPQCPGKSLRNPKRQNQRRTKPKEISDLFAQKKRGSVLLKKAVEIPTGFIKEPRNIAGSSRKVCTKKKKRSSEHSIVELKAQKKSSALSHEQKKAQREEQRKQKYEDLKKAKVERAAKRAERNTVLREHRKKKKEEEKRQREVNEKRMEELRANFLGEDAQLSSVAESVSSASEGHVHADGALETSHSQSNFSGFRKVGCYEMSQLDALSQLVTAETLLEYRWPLNGRDAEHYFLQEQVCEYLGIKSFKRRYPDIARRNVEAEERDYLKEKKAVRDVQADLGLTALPSAQVLDIMSNDFYDKYEEYMTVAAERKSRSLCQTNYNAVVVEKHKFSDFVEKAMKSAASWNKRLNAEKREKRRAYFDMQTLCVHYPMNNRGRMKPQVLPRIGLYPIALIPGQFVDFFKTYSSKQLKYLPLSTASKAPPKDGAQLDGLESEDMEDEESIFLSSDSESSTATESDSSSSSSFLSSMSSLESDDELLPAPDIENACLTEVVGLPEGKCKLCVGVDRPNSHGQPEALLRCSKCHHSYHLGCIQLCQDNILHVTSYGWECTECKACVMCRSHADDDKLLFCDLCDRGYHIYCVGLTVVPSGRWHCRECAECVSCGLRDTDDWVFEYKSTQGGVKIYSHTFCSPCHKSWKRGQCCPECNVVFGKERSPPAEYSNCWICHRQHHLECVGQAVFICSSCQRKTLEKSLGAGNGASAGAAGRRRMPFSA